MAERMKRRQNKARGVNTEDGSQHVSPFNGLPRTILDSQRPKQQKDEAATNNSDKSPIYVPDATAAAEKAKELLRAQRESVNMLTLVKERFEERLGSSKTREKLISDGYAVIDDFLSDVKILNEIENEVGRMMTIQQEENNAGDDNTSRPPMMEVDPTNIGSGEYIAPIQGGNQQYTVCPRIVEFVVSSTKNVPEVFNKNDDDRDSDNGKRNLFLSLDPSACMATLRCFDRKSLKASLSLLTGCDDDGVLDDTYQKAPFDVIARNGDDDQRRLSLYYYVVADTWNNNEVTRNEITKDGGGFTFESNDNPILAKRDRLVLVLSDKTSCKKVPWKGRDDESTANSFASAIELHLIQKRS